MIIKDFLEIGYWVISVGILSATVYYIATGPINAVKIGRKLNIEQQKDNAKRNLFLTLFALRGSPLNYDFVNGLNQIDVVFESDSQVLDAWHKHLNDLHNKGLNDPQRVWEIGRIELLSKMANSLGYGSLNQTDIMQHYYPVGHGDKSKFDFDLQYAATKFFESGHLVYKVMLEKTEEAENAKDQPPTEQP